MAAKYQLPEYSVWKQARQRCMNPKHPRYADYGARGIQMLIDFDVLIAEIGYRPSDIHQLDRINNDGNYESGNVRWSLSSVQANNRRKRRTGFLKGPYKGRTEYTRQALAKQRGEKWQVN